MSSNIKTTSRTLLQVSLLMLFLSGCSSYNPLDLFSFLDKEEEDIKEPAILFPFDEEVTLTRLWSQKIGRGAEDKAIKLVPAYTGSRVFAAAADGKVKAFDASNGRVIWEINIKDFYSSSEQKVSFSKAADSITGGVGVGEDLVLVGSSAGELVAMNQSDGSLAWRAVMTSEILSPPQARNNLVAAQTIDGKVSGFNALDGTRLWQYQTNVPSLTLRGTSTLIMGDLIIAGFSNGRIAGLDPIRGLAKVDQRIAAATGKSDLEKLIDIDGTMIQEASRLFVASYQGNLVSIDLSQNGRITWAKETSSVVGLGSGFGNVYLANEDSIINAYAMDQGSDVWETEALLYRNITTPVAVSSYVVTGDFDGYLHLIAQSDGRFVGRKVIDKSGFSSSPVVDGTRIYVMGNGGQLTALEIR
ncbi:MAG: outer membrane protein assembly factor BamB [Candidatus Azotimanducaceae bacterium]|jgi:outer membrane protein assembly factor BamB